VTKRFGGFLVATEPVVEVPRAFFIDVLPQLTDLNEVQATMAVFRLAAEAGGIEAPVGREALLADRPLRTALRTVGSPREPDRRIADGLDMALARGTLLAFTTSGGREERVWYYVNTPANQALIAAMARGAIPPPVAVWHGDAVPAVLPERPNVFRLYEQNIGLLTPLIADHLVDALETYPVPWIEEAIAEAVAYNRRSWRYVQRILEKWATDGRGGNGGRERNDEAHRRRDPDHFDPDRYKYGRHLRQRGGR
jgi:DnaD/phage-associated family protein